LYGTQAAKTLRQGLFYRSLSIVWKLFKTITFVKLLLIPYSIDRWEEKCTLLGLLTEIVSTVNLSTLLPEEESRNYFRNVVV
jgi:hypothetical protein